MRTERQEARQREIEAAAYEVLAEKGYKATSMLAVAKWAAASNETLYRWYGSKQALFAALVEANARAVRKRLSRSLEDGDDALATLGRIGPLLVELVAGDRAVALNRAAVGDVDETATLGPTIAASGRAAVVPLLERLMQKAIDARELVDTDAAEAAEIYVRLLIGDLQIRRVIGVLHAPSRQEAETRAAAALGLFLRLFGPSPLR
ncbi:TetR family transcriptional regulator [Nitratireductor sp. CAU 1489]|uniref:TetR family transcriptional regulator n=1 Tax=Nitratireductor arenosus TaxID=2682096 RepID=A0A844QGU9_9HYPH|nr:TetR family transcriptional regulator [Nitratireductor arenosus]